MSTVSRIALDLAGIPLHAIRRADDHPVVIAGGHAAFNLEPIADFIDAAVLGDGEEVVLEITGVVRGWKAHGRPGGRRGLLGRLAGARRARGGAGRSRWPRRVDDCPTAAPAPDQLSRCGILVAVVRQVSPAVRPDDVLSALDAVAGLPSSVLVKAIRTAQGRLDHDGGLVDPLAADRAFARTALAPDGLAQSDDRSDQHDVAGHTG